MKVVVDGAEYVPLADSCGRVGVGVTTRNRNKIVAETVERIRNHLPAGAVLFVVDDASETPVEGADYRFEKNVGIARAKNKCLELLMSAGVEHLYLMD